MAEENKNTQPHIIDTYAEDMARVISGDQGSMIKKIIEEEERKEQEKQQYDPESKKNRLYLLLGVLLSAIAVAVITYFFFMRGNNTVAVTPQFTPLVFNDKTFYVEVGELSKEKIVDSIQSEVRATNVKTGGVEGVYLTKNKQIVGLREFVSLMKADWVVPNIQLVSDNYMIGIHNGTQKDVFLLLKTRTFVDIFDSLKTWEGKMFLDLRTLFGISLTVENNYLLTKAFDDGIIENKNARVLHDNAGNPVLMYVFVDDNSVVIANSTEAVREAIVRLSGSEQKK